MKQHVPIECKIPLNFEFEFKIVEPKGKGAERKGPHPDLRVMPMKGIVPGRGSVEIDIEYAPSRPETALLEVELHVSQFGFEPILVSITGSGQYADVVNQRKAKEEAQLKKAEEEKAIRKKKHAFRLRTTKGRNKSQIISPVKQKDDLNRSLEVDGEKIEDIDDNNTRVR